MTKYNSFYQSSSKFPHLVNRYVNLICLLQAVANLFVILDNWISNGNCCDLHTGKECLKEEGGNKGICLLHQSNECILFYSNCSNQVGLNFSGLEKEIVAFDERWHTECCLLF